MGRGLNMDQGNVEGGTHFCTFRPISMATAVLWVFVLVRLEHKQIETTVSFDTFVLLTLKTYSYPAQSRRKSLFTLSLQRSKILQNPIPLLVWIHRWHGVRHISNGELESGVQFNATLCRTPIPPCVYLCILSLSRSQGYLNAFCSLTLGSCFLILCSCPKPWLWSPIT